MNKNINIINQLMVNGFGFIQFNSSNGVFMKIISTYFVIIRKMKEMEFQNVSKVERILSKELFKVNPQKVKFFSDSLNKILQFLESFKTLVIDEKIELVRKHKHQIKLSRKFLKNLKNYVDNLPFDK